MKYTQKIPVHLMARMRHKYPSPSLSGCKNSPPMRIRSQPKLPLFTPKKGVRVSQQRGIFRDRSPLSRDKVGSNRFSLPNNVKNNKRDSYCFRSVYIGNSGIIFFLTGAAKQIMRLSYVPTLGHDAQFVIALT